ncbi:BZ3500_MvSof-1268-A1-R1_Chr12-2g03735 [Microbotryum saponariae]|uniref:BZ3500_MvSof-1268-A1-R1_Chr12-2g03735 protein n=1 Tax=Microbotryum saponariae TaxID=289078 RepID=A0A2X0M0H8_9BASI|nr:BZ3500_MvSof-1268-A1-R1_Chr12-2g03735 [Microbotryum saponariae]SDA05323.1 BZ3501_MvSof-1269-A2-R1_Chr12-1g03307 [Microbotryum saponariae]
MTTIERFDKILYEHLQPETEWTRLGRGSFGCVYKGEYLGLEVAIKEVLPSGEYDVDKYFRRECKIMAEARHPNIVQYLGLCLAPPDPPRYDGDAASRQRILIISEYLPRGNLRQYIDDRCLPFPWRLRLSFAIDVARAVAYLHSRQCLHRDLKGENLLCTANERLKVCDFGFARLAAQTDEEMKRMSYCGTDGYMSPEILLGDEFGLPTDIFSLGVIFIEILSRQLVNNEIFPRLMPTFGIDPLEVRERASLGHPPDFLDLALECLRLDPTRRPSALDVLSRLRRIETQVLAAEAEELSKSSTIGGGRSGSGSGSLNVGSLSFSGTIKRGSVARWVGARVEDSRSLDRPAGPPRLPSWDGQVKVPKTRTGSRVSDSQGQSGVVGSSILRENMAKGVEAQEVQDEEETTDELDDINLLDLADMGSDGPHHRGGAGLELDSDHLYTGSEFNQEWKSHERSSFLCQGQRQAEWSTLTVKAPPLKMTAQSDGRVRSSTMAASSSGSLASLPASWLAQQRKQVDLGPLINTWVQEGQGSGMSERSDGPGSEIVSEKMIPAEPQVRVKAQEQAETSGGEVFHSTIQGHAQDFASARSSDLLPTSSSSLMLIAQPHRFTLIKPGFQKVLVALLTYGQAPPPTIEPSKPTKLLAFVSGSKPKQSRPQTTNLRSSPMVGEDKCAYCEKGFGTFGWRAYLECDDCTIKCHIKCSDEMDLDCHQHGVTTPAQSVTNSSLSAKLRTPLSPLNGGGPKGKLSSARTKWTEYVGQATDRVVEWT